MKLRAAVLATTLVLICAASEAAFAQSAAVTQTRTIWITVPTTASVLQSDTVMSPGTGNLIVTVTGSVNFFHTQGTTGSYCLQLSQTSAYTGGCVPEAGSDAAIRNFIASNYPTTASGVGQSEQYSIVRAWPVSAGSYTFYLNGYATGFTSTALFHPSITVLWVPGTLAP